MPTTITVPSGAGTSAREVLLANRTYYVRTDGSNSHSGLVNDATGAWLTIQYALDFIADTLDLGNNTLTIQVADGTYAESLILRQTVGGIITLQGNGSSSEAVIIQGTSTNVIQLLGGAWNLNFVKIKMGGNGRRGLYSISSGCALSCFNIHLDNAGNTGGRMVYVDGPSNVSIFNFSDNVNIYGNWNNLFYASSGAIISVISNMALVDSPITIGVATAEANYGAQIIINGSITGTATGKQYNVSNNAILYYTGGTLPGDVAGTEVNGGIYNSLDATDVSRNLDLVSTTQGTVLHRTASAWEALSPGTAGQFLKTNGAALDAAWADAPGATGGEANTGANVGTAGTGVFYQKSSLELQFKKLNSLSAALTITDNVPDTEIDFSFDTTALAAAVPVFTDLTAGVVPASGGGINNFLRADGDWTSPTAVPDPHTHDTDDIVSGTLVAGRMPAYTGDVTSSVGTTANTIANDAVTNAKLANMVANRIKGVITAGDPADLTGTQVTTLLDAFTTSLKGVAPASGGGTTNFLRADGSWAAPAASGGVSTVVVDSNGRTLTSAESGIVFTNEGAVARADFTLPAAAVGLNYTFVVMGPTHGIRVIAGAGDVITSLGTGSTSAGGAIEMVGINASKGVAIKLLAVNATDWMAVDNLTGWIVVVP